MGSSLRVLTAAAVAGTTTGTMTALLSSLDWIDFAVSKLSLLDALVRLAILAETVVLCEMLDETTSGIYKDGNVKGRFL